MSEYRSWLCDHGVHRWRQIEGSHRDRYDDDLGGAVTDYDARCRRCGEVRTFRIATDRVMGW